MLSNKLQRAAFKCFYPLIKSKLNPQVTSQTKFIILASDYYYYFFFLERKEERVIIIILI